MPYGIAKDVGGDSPHNVAVVEDCVKRYMRQNMSKQEAIRRCKGGLQKALRSKKR